MNLLQAAQSESVIQAAWSYHQLGLNIIPLNGKQPAAIWTPNGYRPLAWKYWQGRAQTRQDIQAWISAGRFQSGVGLILGEYRALRLGLVVIDCDGLATAHTFEQQFPVLANTLTVLSGSGKGKHFYYLTHYTPKTRYFHLPTGNIEIRSAGCFIVAPPSIHPDTRKPYKVLTAAPPLVIGNLENVLAWLKVTTARALPFAPQALPVRAKNNSSTSGGLSERGAQVALSREAAALRTTPEKGRNIQLNRAAYNMGQLVGDALLTRSEVEYTLYEAARAAGLPDYEAQATLRSGLDAGINNPRGKRRHA